MNKQTVELLISEANILNDKANWVMTQHNDSNAASILRQAAWKIKEAIPPEYRLTALLEGKK